MLALIKFAMCAVMPRSTQLPGVGDTDLDGFLRRLRVEAEPLYWFGVVAGALAFVFCPVLTLGVPLPAFWLPRRLLEAHAERMVSHRIYLVRQCVELVRVTAGMCWGSDPVVRKYFELAPYAPDPGTFRTS